MLLSSETSTKLISMGICNIYFKSHSLSLKGTLERSQGTLFFTKPLNGFHWCEQKSPSPFPNLQTYFFTSSYNNFLTNYLKPSLLVLYTHMYYKLLLITQWLFLKHFRTSICQIVESLWELKNVEQLCVDLLLKTWILFLTKTWECWKYVASIILVKLLNGRLEKLHCLPKEILYLHSSFVPCLVWFSEARIGKTF